MQCQCGSETSSTRLVKNTFKAQIEYRSCPQCGRVAHASLYIHGLQVATDQPGDPAARNLFDSLNKDCAERLYRTAKRLHDSLRVEVESKRQPYQASLF